MIVPGFVLFSNGTACPLMFLNIEFLQYGTHFGTDNKVIDSANVKAIE
jgi:hypothetical protein